MDHSGACDQRFSGLEQHPINAVTQGVLDGIAFGINTVGQVASLAKLSQRVCYSGFGQIARLGLIDDGIYGEIDRRGKFCEGGADKRHGEHHDDDGDEGDALLILQIHLFDVEHQAGFFGNELFRIDICSFDDDLSAGTLDADLAVLTDQERIVVR